MASGNGVPVPPSASDHPSGASVAAASGDQELSQGAFVGEVFGADEDAFDSDEFRAWMRDRRASRLRRRRRDDEDDYEGRDGGDDHRTSSGPPPEWDGESLTFQDYAIKARLWLATTKSRPRARGPLLLQKLSKVPFETMKYLARDASWMANDQNGEELINIMDRPENFGDDREEDLLAALAKVTYHLRRGKDEAHRAFFNKWDTAMRKVKEHRVVLPDKYTGFLLINALNLQENEIKAMLNYTRGSIVPADIREWVRKHETKLQVSQVGIDKKASSSTKATAALNYINAEQEEQTDDEEIYAMEAALRDLQDDEDEDGAPGDQPVLEEHEAAEILSTFLQKKKSQTYTQTMKAKKHKELARGYSQGKDKSYKVSFTGQGRPPFKEGNYKMSIEELKKVTKCGICHRVGHWHRECPEKGKSKEAHNLETLATEEAIFCGHLDRDEPVQDAPPDQDDLSRGPQRPPNRGHESSSAPHGQKGPSFPAILASNSASSADRAYMASFHDGHEVLFGEEARKLSGVTHQTTKGNPINDDACATIDTGCQRMAIGRKTLEKLAQHVPRDVPVHTHAQEHRFKSVHGSSSTQYVASIPTSLGTKGSYLKPAIFDNVESINAPFLISLPFLLACRTTLTLDPETGLTADFKKLGFKVGCHLGPTGALRIPLCNFSKLQLSKLKKFQSQIQRQEFEVLRTCSVAQGSDSDRSHDQSTSPVTPSHGTKCQENQGAAAEQCLSNPDVASLDPEALLCGQDHGILGSQALDSSGQERRANPHPEEELPPATPELSSSEEQQFREQLRGGHEHGILGNGDHTDRSSTDKADTRSTSADGPATEVRAQPANSAQHQLHREELPESLLAMPAEGPMRLLHVGHQAAIHRGGVREVQNPSEETQQSCSIIESIGDTFDCSEPSAASVPPSTNFQARNQRLPGGQEVLGLRNHPDEQEDRPRPGEGDGARAGSQAERPQGHGIQDHPDTRASQTHQGVGSTGSGRCLDGTGRVLDEPSQDPGVTPLNRREKRVLRQARAALSERAENLENIITCLQSPNVTPAGVFEHLACTLATGPDPWGPKKTRQLASILGAKKSQARVVAEVFNPKRFGPKGGRFGINQGESFDLLLGHDILDERIRRTIRQYLQNQRPGLVCVSPPCTWHSIMQNMNMAHREANPEKKREYLTKLTQSIILLHFGIEVCHTVMAYGGSFLFEHPRTSKAWQDPVVQRLQDQPGVTRTDNDQCRFGLRSPEGELHRKPTSWLTNNQSIAQALDLHCQGDHYHQPVLGMAMDYIWEEITNRDHYPDLIKDQLYTEDIPAAFETAYSDVGLDFTDVIQSKEILAANEVPADDEAHAEEEPLVDEQIIAENAEDSASPQRALPLERPLSLESLVRRAHNGMGHISNSRLVSILKTANASDEAIKIAKTLHCPTCEQHKHIDGARKAAPPKNYKPNQVVGVDTVWLPGLEPNKKLKMALNCICWSTRFQLMIPLQDHTPAGAVKAFYQWIRIFGPPERIYCDLGREFLNTFQTMADNNDIYLDPGALEAPTQRSITERSGRTFKETLSKTIMATGVTTWEEWHDAVAVVNATINRLTNKSGFSPAQRMLGYNPRLPGSLLSGGYDDYGVLSKLSNGDLQIQRSMKLRKEAAIAYHRADCEQALRHAIHSAPKKLYDYQPEHLRPASQDEKLVLTDFIDDIVKTRDALTNDNIKKYIILEEKPPVEEQPPGLEDGQKEEWEREFERVTGEQQEEPTILPKYRLYGRHAPGDYVPRDEPPSKKTRTDDPGPVTSSIQVEPSEEEYSPSELRPDELPADEPIGDSPTEDLPEPAEEEARGTTRPNEETDAMDEPPSKRIRTELVEILLSTVMNINQKKRKEVQMNQMSKTEKTKFNTAILKEITTNIQSGAYEVLGREESENIRRQKPEKILKSRYVFTEKPVEPHDLDKITKEGILLENQDLPGPHKAKARHVMKGFSEVGAEDLASTTPQVAKESAFFVLQLITSQAWELGHLDFTQAFHSGDKLQRELYAELPPEGAPGIHTRQLLKLNKTCYGLTDGPYAWYQHVSRVLEELGYTKSRADPCVYYLLDNQDNLEGIIGLATDDMIHGGGKRHWRNMNWLRSNYQMGKFTTGSGTFTGKQIQVNEDGSLTIHQKNYIENNIKAIPIDPKRKKQKYNRCTPLEVGELRALIGGLSWVSKECRPDIAGRVALLQQTMPHPMVRDLLEGNSILEDLRKTADLGVTIQPIPLQHLRVGVVTDASWGNAGSNVQENSKTDHWEETADSWIRHHIQDRRLSFHPGSTADGPDLHSLSRKRITIVNHQQVIDSWDGSEAIQDLGMTWTGRTIFMKSNDPKETNMPLSEKFLQLCKQSSQGGYILFYYDSKIETSDEPQMISIVGWKSYKLKRCTVNTLSAECQSLLEGIGNLHWHRFLLAEAAGKHLSLSNWETQLKERPFIAVTDSKSLYDTVTKCRNSSAHIADKRTAIDLTILKSDLALTQGQLRWVGGTNLISDALTKKMNPTYLRKIMKAGKWTLTEAGHKELCAPTVSSAQQAT
eukprot:Skav207315  [mRNA]  locus=scaffold2296:325139:333057:+ [translate_table: standard]